MSRRLAFLPVLCALTGTTMSFTAPTCRAQWVDVSREGGVYVRAPFVRVHVDAYGGTSVRAPFTAVDVPGRRYPVAQSPLVIERRVVRPSLPRTQELAVMDDVALWQTLRLTADRLHERLGRFDTGASWQRYLRLPEEVLTESPAGSHERRDALTKLLERFRYVTTDRQYARIADLPAFAAMRAALTEVVSRPDSSPAAGDVPDEELPMPPPDRSSRGRLFLNPTSGP